MNYLFINEASKKKKNKRKRKKTNVEQNKVTSEVEEKDEDAGMKKQLIRTINSLSQTDLRVFYDNVSKDNKMKKFLVKSKSNGKYVQSKLIITQENTNNNDNSNNGSILSTPKKEQVSLKSLNSITNPTLTTQKIENVPTPTNATQDKANSNAQSTSPKEGTLISEQEKQTQEKKEKIFHNLIQASDLSTNTNTNTIMINSDSLQNILEKNQITVRWCKICNMIIPNDQDFQVVRRLIGSKGCNMKKIVDSCKSGDQSNVKLRLRGRGSGYKEGPQNRESEDPLHLCISAKNQESLATAAPHHPIDRTYSGQSRCRP